jgi:hypothetical protein
MAGHEALRQAAVAAGIKAVVAGDARAYVATLEDGLRKIEWRHFHYPPTWRVWPSGTADVVVIMEYRVPNRDTGESTIVRDSEARWMLPMEPEEIVLYARERVRRFVLHEADEALRLGEARPFDPHAGDAP